MSFGDPPQLSLTTDRRRWAPCRISKVGSRWCVGRKAMKSPSSNPADLWEHGRPVPQRGHPLPVRGTRRLSVAPTFEIIRALGSGGMADVYLASMRVGDQQEMIALKRIRGGARDDALMRAHLEREARACALLRHDNIVALRAFGEDPDGPYLALEYVEGCSAGDLLRDSSASNPLSVPLIASIALDCACALQYAHDYTNSSEQVAGIIHRDVSLENILISSSGTAKLADFGIARIIGSDKLTRAGIVKGKFGYLAPEVIRGMEASPASDLFSYAATLFILLCGVPPFPGDTDESRMHATLYVEPPPIARFRPSVPPLLAAWIHRALGKDPVSRPRTLDGLIEILEEICPGDELTRRAAVAERAVHISRTLASQQPTVRARLPGKVRARRPWALVAFTVGMATVAACAAWLLTRASALPAPVPHPVTAAPPARPLEQPTPVPSPPTPLAQNESPSPPTSGAHHRSRPSSKRTRSDDRVAAPKPEPAAVAAAAPAALTAGPLASGSLWVRVRPWAAVYVDGSAKGTTPLEPFSLPVGKHVVRLVNEELHEDRSYPVSVDANQTRQLRVNFAQAPAP
jgi:serine/threonine protein kinase